MLPRCFSEQDSSWKARGLRTNEESNKVQAETDDEFCRTLVSVEKLRVVSRVLKGDFKLSSASRMTGGNITFVECDGWRWPTMARLCNLSFFCLMGRRRHSNLKL